MITLIVFNICHQFHQCRESLRQMLGNISKMLSTSSLRSQGKQWGQHFLGMERCMYVIGGKLFQKFAEKNQNEISHCLISSVHKSKPSQRSPLSKQEHDQDIWELIEGDFSKLNVSTLRRMVGLVTQHTIGKFVFALLGFF